MPHIVHETTRATLKRTFRMCPVKCRPWGGAEASVKRPAAEHAFRSGQERRAAGERHRVSSRDLLVRQRTQCVNALRGHLLEYGYVFPKGITHVETLVALIEDLQSSLPDSVRLI